MACERGIVAGRRVMVMHEHGKASGSRHSLGTVQAQCEQVWSEHGLSAVQACTVKLVTFRHDMRAVLISVYTGVIQ